MVCEREENLMASWDGRATVNSLFLHPPSLPFHSRERGGTAAVKERTPSALTTTRRKGELRARIPGVCSYTNRGMKRDERLCLNCCWRGDI